MHLYYNVHAQEDIKKLAELMTVEKQMRDKEKSPSQSESPSEQRGKRQAKFVFQTINGVSAMVGLALCIVGTVLFYTHKSPSNHFGSVGYIFVSVTLGLDGVSLAMVAGIGLLFRINSKSQMIVYTVGGAMLFCVMLVATIVRLPDANGLLSNVSMEMSESLLMAKLGKSGERDKWDSIQQSLHCCGLLNFHDWCEARNLTQLQEHWNRKCRIPKSCFSKRSHGMPASVHKEFDSKLLLFEAGCYRIKMQSLFVEMSLLKSFVYVILTLLAFDVLFAVLLIIGMFDVDFTVT